MACMQQGKILFSVTSAKLWIFCCLYMYVHIYCVGIGTRLRKYRESPILELSCPQQHLSASQNAKVKQLQHGNMIRWSILVG